MEAFERRQRVRFDIMMTHDAEDLIHPESLRLINWFSRDLRMVQVPVLALPTPGREFTHGVYCDEFAEYQLKDIPVRQRLGGFLPVQRGRHRLQPDGAGTTSPPTRGGRIFDPACLTEDYENGYRLHAAGLPPDFLPIRFDRAGPMATREYFPRTLARRRPAAQPLGHGNRAAGLAASRLARPVPASSTGSGATARA